MKKCIAVILLCTVLTQLFGCTAPREEAVEALRLENLTAQLESREPEELSLIDYAHSIPTADFSVALLKASYQEGQTESLVLSPYSALLALAMTANGAQGETLSQMEAAFGMGRMELNSFLYLCLQQERQELISANSLWLGASTKAKESFLQTNKDYLKAQVFRTTFDAEAIEEMNAWVKENTKGRIEELVDRLGPDTVIVLLNALSFDAKWETPFESHITHTATFYAADGTEQEVQMMQGTVSAYLEDGLATGFIKEYQNGYCYVALLPNEGVSMEDYLASLTGAGLAETVEKAEEGNVDILMPKLDSESTLELNDALKAMGIQDAFGSNADFSAMGGGYISRVLQKTALTVNEAGTQAAVASAVIADKGMPFSMRTVTLDRPYVMAILDRETGTVLFMGVVNEI